MKSFITSGPEPSLLADAMSTKISCNDPWSILKQPIKYPVFAYNSMFTLKVKYGIKSNFIFEKFIGTNI